MKKDIKRIYLVFLLVVIGLLLHYIITTDNPKSNIEEVPLSNVEELKDTKVFLDGVLQTARDVNGRKKSPIKYQGITYIPISEVGYFLGDKRVEIQEDTINLKTEVLNKTLDTFETTTLDGKKFSNENFKNFKYTVVFSWTSWCPYCEEVLVDLEEFSKKYEKEGIQVIGLLLNDDFEEAERKVIEKGVTFKTLKTNEYLKYALQSNINSIPEYKVIDKDGNITTETINGEQSILELKENIETLILNECNVCQ